MGSASGPLGRWSSWKSCQALEEAVVHIVPTDWACVKCAIGVGTERRLEGARRARHASYSAQAPCHLQSSEHNSATEPRAPRTFPARPTLATAPARGTTPHRRPSMRFRKLQASNRRNDVLVVAEEIV